MNPIKREVMGAFGEGWELFHLFTLILIFLKIHLKTLTSVSSLGSSPYLNDGLHHDIFGMVMDLQAGSFAGICIFVTFISCESAI